ncbi:conserved hypothetical protein [Beutenbergia cavernae DSM 12333]|uniref:Glyoxalase-like domain-containing protein n=1 Tax=Beutenbergia cavernae (strain ATCC BAA-8 / DSM 12333 / CCUG 43141 / JCM 11478 / NBRC 16432 / NCIMB 13614 / HKI 0122) TaxID=471853 RepID=C5C4V3_BEUC1|nr:VOC family protein [Beutenbergia cavernae]ACQ80081.1 conserved hypothetical protein [Beutenbergia cavernae DSM 12333]
MHRSRLTAIGVDTPAEHHAATTAFWAGALGGTARSDDEGTYTGVSASGVPSVFVQKLGEGAARIHLDIETDDVDAEVARLEALGASRVEQVHSWWVMRDPAGNLFCVVQPQTDDFPAGTTTWD